MNKNELNRKSLVKILTKVMETNIELMTFYKHIATDDNSRKICAKSIRQSKKAIEILPKIEHIDILTSIYNTIISGKESIFVSGASILASKKTQYYDKTEKGFKKFCELEKEAREKNEKERQERIKENEFVKKAKAEGKQVSYMYDKESGKVKPVVVENK